MKRRTLRERFAWHSVRHYVRQHRREYTDAEKDAALDICPRCALLAQLMGVLESRIQGVQLGLN